MLGRTARLLIAIHCLVATLAGCTSTPAPATTPAASRVASPTAARTVVPPLAVDPGTPAIALDAKEVREYQGEKLGAIDDFRENSISGPRQVARESYRLTVDGLVERPTTLSYDEVLGRQRYQKMVQLNCVEGWSVNVLWEGVLLGDLLELAGAKDEAKVVIFHAADTYTSTLPVQYIRDNQLLLAAKMNGVTLPAERGFPFQVVAEDKWGYKWVRWVTRIELSADENYRGYWERNGYSKDGALSGPMFEGR
ncbi:MAG: molybdopterin-dependent oxidoreductase [Chloroflexota bacterium]